jgi:hypothetical protein
VGERRFEKLDVSALIAVGIGLLAVVVSGYTAYLQRQQVQAQVWPRVEMMRMSGRRSFMVHNAGLGPARMMAARVTVDGRPMKTWKEAFEVFGYHGALSQGHLSTRVLTPGQELEVIRLVDEGDEAAKIYGQLLGQNEHKLGILGCYCSVLGQCWEVSMGKVDDRRVDADREVGSCRIREDERFEE